MSAVDAVIARGYVDKENLFVTGGSGGGVLTAWIVGKTDPIPRGCIRQAGDQLVQSRAHRGRARILLSILVPRSSMGERRGVSETVAALVRGQRENADHAPHRRSRLPHADLRIRAV